MHVIQPRWEDVRAQTSSVSCIKYCCIPYSLRFSLLLFGYWVRESPILALLTYLREDPTWLYPIPGKISDSTYLNGSSPQRIEWVDDYSAAEPQVLSFCDYRRPILEKLKAMRTLGIKHRASSARDRPLKTHNVPNVPQAGSLDAINSQLSLSSEYCNTWPTACPNLFIATGRRSYHGFCMVTSSRTLRSLQQATSNHLRHSMPPSSRRSLCRTR